MALDTSAIDPHLQGLLAEYTHSKSKYNGFDIAPFVPIDGDSGEYPKDAPQVFSVDQDDKLGYDPTQASAKMSDPMPIVDEIEKGSIVLSRWANSYPLPDVSNAAALGIDDKARAIRKLAEFGIKRHAVLLGQKFVASEFATGWKEDGPNLNTESNGILGTIKDGVRAVLDHADGALGPEDLCVIMNPEVRDLCAGNIDFRKSLAGGSEDQRVMNSTIAKIIAGETDGAGTIIASKRYKTGGNLTYCFGDHIAIVACGGKGELSFVQTFVNEQFMGDAGAGAQAVLGRLNIVDPPRKDGLEAILWQYFKVQVEHQKLGYLIYDVTS